MPIEILPYKKGLSGKRYKYSWGIPDSYLYYEKEVTDNLKIDKNIHANILKDFFLDLSKLIIRENYEFKVPYSMGYIMIKKRKNFKEASKNKVDWSHYKKTGKITYLHNLHTDRYYFYFNWDKKKFGHCVFNHNYYYDFIPSRGDKEYGKKGLSEWINKTINDPYIKDYDAII